MDYRDIQSKFSIRNPEFPDEDLCYLVPGQRDSISDCNFKNDSQTFLIIHGWSVSSPMTVRKHMQFVCFAWNNAVEIISPIYCYFIYLASIMNNGCVTRRSPVCLRAGSISWCRLCLNVNPEPMSLLWTGWIGPTNTTPNQQKTPDWWGRTWPSLSTGWRYSLCAEKHIVSVVHEHFCNDSQPNVAPHHYRE